MIRTWTAVVAAALVLAFGTHAFAEESDPTLALWESVYRGSGIRRDLQEEIIALGRTEALRCAVPFLRAPSYRIRFCAQDVAEHYLGMTDMPLLLDEWARAQAESLETGAASVMRSLFIHNRDLTQQHEPGGNDLDLTEMWKAVELDVDKRSRMVSRIRASILDLDPGWGSMEVWSQTIGSAPSAVAMVEVWLTPEKGMSFFGYDEIWVKRDGDWTRMASVGTW